MLTCFFAEGVEDEKTYEFTYCGTIVAPHCDVEHVICFLFPGGVVVEEEGFTAVRDDVDVLIGDRGEGFGVVDGVEEEGFCDRRVKVVDIEDSERMLMFVGDAVEPFHDVHRVFPLFQGSLLTDAVVYIIEDALPYFPEVIPRGVDQSACGFVREVFLVIF